MFGYWTIMMLILWHQLKFTFLIVSAELQSKYARVTQQIRTGDPKIIQTLDGKRLLLTSGIYVLTLGKDIWISLKIIAILIWISWIALLNFGSSRFTTMLKKGTAGLNMIWTVTTRGGGWYKSRWSFKNYVYRKGWFHG